MIADMGAKLGHHQNMSDQHDGGISLAQCEGETTNSAPTSGRGTENRTNLGKARWPQNNVTLRCGGAAGARLSMSSCGLVLGCVASATSNTCRAPKSSRDAKESHLCCVALSSFSVVWPASRILTTNFTKFHPDSLCHRTLLLRGPAGLRALGTWMLMKASFDVHNVLYQLRGPGDTLNSSLPKTKR